MSANYINRLLSQQESIQLVTHRHWLFLLRDISLEMLSAVIIAVLGTLSAATPMFSILFPLVYLLILIPLASLLIDIARWWNHQYIVTNRRVIQVMGIVNKNVADSSLEKVNDVLMEQSLFGRLFNYGDIEILTASELGINRFTRIADPIAFKKAMLNAKELMHLPDERRPALAQNLKDLNAQLDSLHQAGILSEVEYSKKKAQLLKK